MQRLGVYFESRQAGILSEEDGRFAFAYAASWLDDRASFLISRSLPLQAGSQAGPAAHAFFANLLPEGRIRSLVARRLGVSEDNDPGQIRGRDWRRLAESVGVGPAFLVETVGSLAQEIPERAGAVAAELRRRHGGSAAAEMILRKRARRTLQLLRQ